VDRVKVLGPPNVVFNACGQQYVTPPFLVVGQLTSAAFQFDQDESVRGVR
jgi:hypothetical protein